MRDVSFVCCSVPSPILNCEICDLFKLWVNHSLDFACQLICSYTFCLISFSPSLSGLFTKKKKKYIYMDLLKKFFGASFSLLFFSLYEHDTEIQSLHETPGCENKAKTRGCFSHQPPETVWQSDAVLFQKVSPFFPRSVPSLSSRRKLILVISAHALNRKQ